MSRVLEAIQHGRDAGGGLPLVVKKDGRREAFDRGKILTGLQKGLRKAACRDHRSREDGVEDRVRLDGAGGERGHEHGDRTHGDG